MTLLVPTENLSFLDAAKSFPNRIAVVSQGQAHTYEALAAQVREFSENLRGISRVAFVPRCDLPSLIRIWALIEAGVTFVPLHEKLNGPQRKEVLKRSSAIPIDEANRAQRSSVSAVDDSDLAIVFTSGTTGKPKGVRLSRRAFKASAAASAANLGWQEQDRWMLSLPPAHVGGLSVIIRCLIARRTVVLHPGSFDASGFAKACRDHKVTIGSLVPTMLHRLLAAEETELGGSFRALLLGGAEASVDLLQRGLVAGLPVLPTYGMTETCSQVATRRPGDHRLGTDVGTALSGVSITVENGRIAVAGEVLFSGYLGEKEHAGAFLTEDYGALDSQGRLSVLGRADDLIISGGENIHPIAVEEHLCALPEVRDACVFGVVDAEWGQVVAAVVETELSMGELRAKTRNFAPLMRPRLLAISDLGWSRRGKRKRDQVAARYLEWLSR